MQTEERQQFRINPQVLAIVAVALLALALPITFVILSLRTALETKSAPPAPAGEVSAPLQKALEDIADKSLPSAGLGEEEGALVRLRTDDPERELTRVEALLKTFDAVALPAVREGPQIRLRIALAGNQAGPFIAACEGNAKPADSAAGNADRARTMVEVVIIPKALP